MRNHEHDRFIQDEDKAFIFGCINPFCGHGSPALPNRYKVPKKTKEVTMRLLTHINGKLQIEVKIIATGKIIVLECDDNLEACSEAFTNIDTREKVK